VVWFDSTDFKKQYLDSLREKDERKALNLLRGFIFYITVNDLVYLVFSIVLKSRDTLLYMMQLMLLFLRMWFVMMHSNRGSIKNV
jgi:hypothetical protein